MKHALYSITRAEVVGPWTLKVEFDDGSRQVINFRPILAGVLYGPLRDQTVFNQVRVDTEVGTIVWPNGADFDPATLHDWPEYENEWVAQAQKWEKGENAATEAAGLSQTRLMVAESGNRYAADSATGLRSRMTPDKPLIQLWSARTFGLIVLRPSGVYYSNQTGGYSCSHPMVEGVFIPLDDDFGNQEEKLSEYFKGTKWNGWCCNGIDGETADFIDSVMAESDLTKDITVDRARFADSQEAWVYVDFKNTVPYGYGGVEISGFGICKGVLTWANSD